MKTCLVWFAVAFLGLTALAEELRPEIAAASTTFKSASTSLQDQKAQAREFVRKTYLAALETADRAATTAGTVPAIRAIAKEREALTKHGNAEAFPPNLP